MAGWNFADLWEQCATIRDQQPALVHGDKQVSWAEFNRRANGLATTMLSAGVEHQDKVAQYLYNCPEYLEGVYACFKASLVPVNTNYRYAEAELRYLWDNSDAAVVMFGASFTQTIETIRSECPKVKLWLHVEDGTEPCPEWATPWEHACSGGTDTNVSGASVDPDRARSGDDLWFLYTGGTTGMPKGVMWTQHDLLTLSSRTHPLPLSEGVTLDDFARSIVENPAPVVLPGAPLMHGTGHLGSLGQITRGGTVVTLTKRSYDVVELLDAVEANRVSTLIIVGDVFCRPILDALDAEPNRWDLSSIELMVSSGVMWSQEVKERLLEHMPTMVIFDALSSSEALGMGTSFSSKANISTTAKFDLGDRAAVIRDDGALVQPGSGDIGRLGVQGILPVGYYKDKAKTAATFPTIDGVRYSLPGDYATIESDGTITLLGRGSVCINTGGEKVFPEEVEEALKTDPGVADAIVVGVADKRFGQRIVAVVEPSSGLGVDPQLLIDRTKGTLAHYKAPKEVLVVDSLTRAANGKIDYKKWSAYATEHSENDTEHSENDTEHSENDTEHSKL